MFRPALRLMKTFIVLILVFLLGLPSAQAIQAWSRKERPLTCPKELRSTGTLLIGLGPHHGAEMVIIRKNDGIRFVIAARRKNSRTLDRDFSRTTMFQMKVDAVIRSADGKSYKAFDAPGEYQVIVSNDIMDESRGYKCTFTFTG